MHHLQIKQLKPQFFSSKCTAIATLGKMFQTSCWLHWFHWLFRNARCSESWNIHQDTDQGNYIQSLYLKINRSTSNKKSFTILCWIVLPSGTQTYPCWVFSLFQEWFRSRKPPRPSVMRENPAWRAIVSQKSKDVCAHLASVISSSISFSVPKNNRSSEPIKKKRRRFKFWRKSQSDEINGETKATRKGSKLQWRLWKKKTESTAEQQAEAPNVTAGKNQKKKAAKQKTQQPRKWWKFWEKNRVDADAPPDISPFWAIHTKNPWYKEPVMFEPPKTAPLEFSANVHEVATEIRLRREKGCKCACFGGRKKNKKEAYVMPPDMPEIHYKNVWRPPAPHKGKRPAPKKSTEMSQSKIQQEFHPRYWNPKAGTSRVRCVPYTGDSYKCLTEDTSDPSSPQVVMTLGEISRKVAIKKQTSPGLHIRFEEPKANDNAAQCNVDGEEVSAVCFTCFLLTLQAKFQAGARFVRCTGQYCCCGGYSWGSRLCLLLLSLILCPTNLRCLQIKNISSLHKHTNETLHSGG